MNQTATTIRLDPALISAFGLPGCADQSSILQLLNAATVLDVADLQAALGHHHPRCLKWEAWKAFLRSKHKKCHLCCQALRRED